MVIDKLRLFKHFFTSTRKRGLSRTLRISAYEVPYNRHFGGNTGLVLPVSSLDFSDEIGRHAQPYFPSSFLFLHEIFSRKEIDCRNAVFVDLGCGMGRVLLFASSYPFQKIIGVEASNELCELARINMRRYYQRQQKRAPEWSIEKADVRDFQIPDAASIFYMYNPFDATVLKRVADCIIELVAVRPRSCIMIYANPVHENVLISCGFNKMFAVDDDFAVYRLGPLHAKSGTASARPDRNSVYFGM